MLRGYGMELSIRSGILDIDSPLVTSSQNFVGRIKGPIPGSESSRCQWEGAFSLSKRVVEAM